MILNKEELNARLKEIFGESTEDRDIAFIEDVNDTFDSYENNADKERITQLEDQLNEMKKKYRDRFFSVEVQEEKESEYSDGEETEKVRYEDLFEEVK